MIRDRLASAVTANKTEYAARRNRDAEVVDRDQLSE
jgi:hypothetical protein